MAQYRIHFVDHGENVYATEHVQHDDERELIETMRRREAHGIGAGFDLYEGDRLVYRHRK